MKNGSVRERRMQADYINVAASGDPENALCGTGFTALNEKPSAQTKSKRYVNMQTSRQSVTGYEWSVGFEADQIPSEKALAYVVDIGRNLRTGPAAETDYTQVDLDKPVTGKDNVFEARQRTVAVAVSEFSDNDGEMGVSGDFLGVTDPVAGTFDTTTCTFTAGAPAVG